VIVRLGIAGMFAQLDVRGRVVKQVFGGPRALFLVKLDPALTMDYVDKRVLAGEFTMMRHVLPKYRVHIRPSEKATRWLKFFEDRAKEGFVNERGDATHVWARVQDLALDFSQARINTRVEVAFVGGAEAGAGKVTVLPGRFAGLHRYYKPYKGKRTAVLVALDEPMNYYEIKTASYAPSRGEYEREEAVEAEGVKESFWLPSCYVIPEDVARTLVGAARSERWFYDQNIGAERGWGAAQIEGLRVRSIRLHRFASRFLDAFPLGRKHRGLDYEYVELVRPIKRTVLRRMLYRFHSIIEPRHTLRGMYRTFDEQIWHSTYSDLAHSSLVYIIPVNMGAMFDTVLVRPLREDLAEYLEVEAAEATRGVR
jgi:hypothetical protein